VSRRARRTSRGARTATGGWRWLTLAVLSVSLLLISIDNTILNVALPSIVRDLHASSSELQWIVDAYAVVFAGLLLTLGSLGDRVGRKWVFMAGLAVFVAGSAASAFSGSPDRLVASRAFMGIGAAAIMPSTLSILTNVFISERDRARAIGIWSGTSGLGVAVGPVAGGWLLDHYWWGSVFLVNVPIGLLGLLASTWIVPNSRTPASRRPDLVGVALSTLGLGSLLWGVIEAPNRTWSSPLVIAALLGAGVALAGFVAWERHTDHPMLPLAFFRSRRFSAAIGSLALLLFALFGALFVLTQYLQFDLGYTPLQTGLRVAPIAAVLLVVAPLSTLAARWLGTKPVVCGGMLLVASGLALLARTSVADTYRDVMPAFFLLGVGVGLAMAPSTDSVMGAVPRHDAGVGSATNGTALQVGGALGVGVLGTALNGRYQGRLAPLLAHHAVPLGIQKLVLGSLGGAMEVAQHVGGQVGAALSGAARSAFLSGMDLGMVVAAAVVGVASVVVAITLPNRPSRTSPIDQGPSGGT